MSKIKTAREMAWIVRDLSAGGVEEHLKEWAESIVDTCADYAKTKHIEIDGWPGDWTTVIDKESIQLVKELIK